MGQNKKITVARELPVHELNRLVGQCFNLTDTVVGVTDTAGKFIELSRVSQELAGQKGPFSLVTVKELKQENMSFGKCRS